MNKNKKEQLIEAFKRSNKQRRQKIAEKNGFTTPEAYLASLQGKKTIQSKFKGIFYIVDILDATGSMQGGKYNNSKEGIIAGIKDLQSRKDVKYSLIEFIDSSTGLKKIRVNENPLKIDINDIKFSGANGSNTPLYWAICQVINSMNVNKEDKVLINVYTDGGDNGPYHSFDMTRKAAELIKKVQKENFTVTFVATPEDLIVIKRDINIDDSNTLATANTAEGFKMSMGTTRSARDSYFTASLAGENTLVGFYKKQEKL